MRVSTAPCRNGSRAGVAENARRTAACQGTGQPEESPAIAAAAIRFGCYDLRADEGRLLADGQVSELGPRAVALLVVLVAERQRVVSKRELLAAVWPGREVSESNLHTQVSNLRSVLGEGAIATVPGRGYRFTLQVDEGRAPHLLAAPAAAPADWPPRDVRAPSASSQRAAAVTSTRRLAAVLHADVVGYSRHMSHDEQGTLQALVDLRSLLTAQVGAHAGRVVDTAGDSVLAQFASALDSVRCALAIQVQLTEREAARPEPERMVLRIGVNAGDVLEQGDAVYGDVVNVAARLQAMGEPGGVCISGPVFDQVEGKVQVAVRSAGEQAVKNIAKLVRAYHLGEAAGQPIALDEGAASAGYRFGRFDLRPEQRLLLHEGEPAKLGARAFDVLLALLQRRERMVSKNELLDLVWPDTVVEEGNLQTQVSNLRKLLGAGVLETIPGRGYRFIAPLLEDVQAQVPVPAPVPSAAPAATATQTTPTLPAPELKTNLPEALAPLLGREDDVAALGALMAEHRLISIVAAGGMGKTRLAQQLLHARRQAYKHGVCWVELAGVADPSLVASTIASALGIRTGNGDPLQVLVIALKELDLLLGVDNAEHLVEGVAQVVQTIGEGAPNTRLIVTSQTPLKVTNERVYRLAALGVPDHAASVQEALSFGAVALFNERAGAAERRFRLDEQNLGTVIEICRQLDGMALAIELAAARVPLLGVHKLAATLNERLRVLTGGTRQAPQRHKTLRAALEWSHALLSEQERVAFRRLSVFAGSFSLEMAQKVVANETDEYQLDEWAVLDTLGNLVDRSLVMALDSAVQDERPRYKLLESPRAYALEQLAAHANEHQGIQRRHADAVLVHFSTVDGDRWEGRIGVDPGIALLEPDLDNAREALAWFLVHDHERAVALTPGMFYGLTYDRFEECSRMWETTEQLMQETFAVATRVAWAMQAAHFWLDTDPGGKALPWSTYAVRMCQEGADRRGCQLAYAYRLIAVVASGKLDERYPATQAVLRGRGTESMPDVVRMEVQVALGFAHLFVEDGASEAEAHFREVEVLAAKCSSRYGMTLAWNSLATIAQVRKDWSSAIRLYRQGLAQFDVSRDAYSHAMVKANFVAALVEMGQLAAASEAATAVWRLMRRFGMHHYVADALALHAALSQRPGAAAGLLGFADARYRQSQTARQPIEARMANQAAALADAVLGDAEFERQRTEGATLTDAQAEDLIPSTATPDAVDEPRNPTLGQVPEAQTRIEGDT